MYDYLLVFGFSTDFLVGCGERFVTQYFRCLHHLSSAFDSCGISKTCGRVQCQFGSIDHLCVSASPSDLVRSAF